MRSGSILRGTMQEQVCFDSSPQFRGARITDPRGSGIHVVGVRAQGFGVTYVFAWSRETVPSCELQYAGLYGPILHPSLGARAAVSREGA